jgi:hypothetical protein
MGGFDVSADDRDKITGGLFRAYVGAVDAMGLRAEVHAAVPPEVRKLMEAPPLHSVWLPGDDMPVRW